MTNSAKSEKLYVSFARRVSNRRMSTKTGCMATRFLPFRIQQRHADTGYQGYVSWIAAHGPASLAG